MKEKLLNLGFKDHGGSCYVYEVDKLYIRIELATGYYHKDAGNSINIRSFKKPINREIIVNLEKLTIDIIKDIIRIAKVYF